MTVPARIVADLQAAARANPLRSAAGPPPDGLFAELLPWRFGLSVNL